MINSEKKIWEQEEGLPFWYVYTQTSNFDDPVSTFAWNKTISSCNISMDVVLLLKVATTISNIKGYLNLLW